MAEQNGERVVEGAEYAGTWLAFQQQLHRIPGVQIAVRLRGDLVFSAAYGKANLETGEALRTDHIFRVASHSKTFTATAIMQLKDAGALRLDDPLSQYVPGLPAGVGATTIRQALAHSSGTTRDGADCDYWQLDRPFPDAEALRGLGETILPANERFKYSNIAYSLLGEVVAAVSRTPYNEYVRRHIVERLGLAATGPETETGMMDRLVAGYTGPTFPLERRRIPDVPTNAMSAATGFYSTAEDLTAYASAHLPGDERLLSDAAKREMQQPYWTVDPQRPQDGQFYGLGFAIRQLDTRRLVGHGGSFPGHATRTYFDPADGLAVSVLTNESGGPSAALAETVFRIIDYAAAQPDAGDADPSRYTGRFANLWGVTDVAAFGNRLAALDPAAGNPVESPTDLEIIDSDTLRIVHTGGYGSPGETVRYTRATGGEIERIRFGGSTFYPLERFQPAF